MEVAFDSYVYNSVEAGEMCNTIAANVMNKIKAFKFDRLIIKLNSCYTKALINIILKVSLCLHRYYR